MSDELDPPPRAVLGIVLVPCDVNMQDEAPELVRACTGVALKMQRIDFGADRGCLSEIYLAHTAALKQAAAVLDPPRLTVLGLGCTSMSFVLGPDKVDAALDTAPRSTDTARAQVAAIRAVGGLGRVRVALLTPYLDHVHAANVQWLESHGLEVVRQINLGIRHSEEVSRVPWDRVKRLVSRFAGLVDAIVIGCTAFRVCVPGRIAELENLVGVPVVTSTQALLWDMLRSAGIDDQIPGYGRLLAEH